VYLTHGPSGPNPRPKGLAHHALCRFGARLWGHVSTWGVEGQGGGDSQWRPLHPADRPPCGTKPTYPSQLSSPQPNKYSPTVKMRGHTPHFGDSTCKALILSVVARHSLVGRVARLWGPKGLLGAPLIARAWKLYRNSFGFDGIFWALVDQVWEFCQNSGNSDREPTLESL
jgi:hypothetical protein